MRSRRRPGQFPANTVLRGDCLAELAKLASASVDLVFADPPYNLQLAGDLMRPNNPRVDGVDQDWDKFTNFAAYETFCRAWASVLPSPRIGHRRPIRARCDGVTTRMRRARIHAL